MDLSQLVDVFLVIFIGMGPIKVLLVYIAMTEGMSQEVRHQVARRTVMVAGAVALGLFLIGAILQAILHFSIGSLTIFGGLILLVESKLSFYLLGAVLGVFIGPAQSASRSMMVGIASGSS
mgnify:CR=1 FL=1